MNFKLVKQGLIITLLLVISFSCHNLFNGDDDEPVNEFLVSYEPIRSYTPAQIEWIFNNFFSDYPDLMNLKEKFKLGFGVYRINYKTTFQEESKTASGLVCKPVGEGPFPVLSYQNGTNTEHSNAPSVNPDRDLYRLLEFVASTGFIVAIPDYLGFGSSDNMFHPYLHKESTVQSVLDMLRAINEFCEIEEVSIKNELFITGYSQGGWATMHLQKVIEEQFSHEFNLTASAPCAGPYDLEYINDYIKGKTTYPMPYFLGYICYSYNMANEMTTPIDEIFNETYAENIPSLFNGTNSGDSINAQLTTSVNDLLTTNYLENFNDTVYSSLRSAFERNSIKAWHTNIPTRIIHGNADELVPYQVSKNIYDDFLTEGVSNDMVQLIELQGLGHSEGIIPAGLISLTWFLEYNE